MKTTNIGMVLLTILVVTKYVISLHTPTSKDGSFKSGLSVNYSKVPSIISALEKPKQPDLLAYHEPQPLKLKSETVGSNRKNITPTQHTASESVAIQNTPSFNSHQQEPLPMEYLNSMVVYDPSNPVISEMKTQYVDQYDEASPLDNGNTLVNEMQLMMPRR